jgi:glucose-6-phosphate-specific signal transduction histidine kinase
MPSSSEGKLPSRSETLRSFAGTSLFCTAIAFTLWLLGLAYPLWASFLVSFSIGYSIMLASLVFQPWMLRALPPIVASAITTLIGIGLGLALAGFLLYEDFLLFLRYESYGTPLLALFFGVLGLLFFRTQSRLHEARTELANARAEQLAREKAHLETQLKLLQAQIEPHFLFNTLGNVVGMVRTQPEAAEKTLIDLTTLLRAALKRTRTEQSTLADELAVITALLEINQIRMGSRLTWSVDVPEDLESIPLPPMLLQPLVENAVKHGIEPQETGGSIHIEVERQGDALVIKIADTGAGLDHGESTAGSGVGISNVQSRLSALYGQRASLTLTENTPKGLIATLRVPVAAE